MGIRPQEVTMQKRISVGKHNVLSMLVPGAGWVLSGLAGALGLDGVAPAAVSCLILLTVAVSLVLSVVLPHEHDDEMSLANRGRAGSAALIVVLALLCGVLAANYLGVQLPTVATVEMMMGAAMFSFGAAFAGYEKAGL